MTPQVAERIAKIQKQVSDIQQNMHAKTQAKAHWDGIAKPLDGLGKLEDIVCEIAGITGNPDIQIDKRAVIAMCADNGIVARGVTQSGQEVTAIVAANMAKGIASVCRMGKKAGVDVIPVNIGIHDQVQQDGLIAKCIRPGTRDFLTEPAMTEEEVVDAIETGIGIVKSCRNQGYQILATGEMGIGNTTTSSAIASVLLELPASEVTGKGAGLSKSGVERKIAVIAQAIEKYQLSKEDPFRVLQCVGGLDIAGLVGLYVGGVLYHTPIIIDGVIAAVAALCAQRIFPGCKDAMIASHRSEEPATNGIMKELGFAPIIDGNLALGEGTGAVLLFPLLDMALEVYHENTTFGDIHVSQYQRFEGEKL